MSDKKILVVDDEAAIRSLLFSAVRAPGVSVFQAEDGRNALSLAKQHGPFELVITDVLMPEMDGIELARKLLEAGYADRFLFVSGYCDLDESPERIRDLRIASFLAKPFSIPALLHSVRELLSREPHAVAGRKRAGSA
jgi:CheY-like chemotaxis protein